jgi:hypothetical protein
MLAVSRYRDVLAWLIAAPRLAAPDCTADAGAGSVALDSTACVLVTAAITAMVKAAPANDSAVRAGVILGMRLRFLIV